MVKQPTTAAAAILLTGAALFYLNAQEQEAGELAVPHAECALFGPKQGQLRANSLEAQRMPSYSFSRSTAEVVSLRSYKPAGERPAEESSNIIDTHLRQVWSDAGITPARKTNDFEFIRRVTLDLTGRTPTAIRVQQFVADVTPDKRARLVDELLNSSAWVDKWTMFFGDLYKNTVRTAQVVRYNEGRNAFYQWIRQSLTANKPYSQIATELITAQGTNSYEKGELNWPVGGFVTGGPVQDIFDQSAANVAEQFLGIAHFNCLLCHDGRRHLDTLSLWGRSATRYSAYQMAAFFSQTTLARTRVNAASGTPYYWSVQDNRRTDYNLNTTTGNRPARTAIGTLRAVTPEYPFSGGTPSSGENYRAALARELTNDIQFSRAAVNYIWKEFMSKAFVEPANQFDLARLDPDNPPPDPWTLQPTQPRLLNAMAADFARNNFDLKALMRTIVNSEAYQLQSTYSGQWNPAWENTYARKLVRRLWAEEVHDAITLSSNIGVTYAVNGLPNVAWAMQLPDVVNIPGGAIRTFLDSFMRGNRDSEERRSDGSTLQALNLMNDTFVMSRTRASGTVETGSLLRRNLGGTNEQLVSALYINVLSRYPSEEEKNAALAYLGTGTRQQRAEDLLWSLYNKVDFVFNY